MKSPSLNVAPISFLLFVLFSIGNIDFYLNLNHHVNKTEILWTFGRLSVSDSEGPDQTARMRTLIWVFAAFIAMGDHFCDFLFIFLFVRIPF